MGFIKLWDELIGALIGRNSSRGGIKRGHMLYADLKGLYSGNDRVTYLYTIDAYPRELPLGFRNSIRAYCKDGVRVNFVTLFQGYDIAWESAEMKSKLNTWREIDRDSGTPDSYNLHSLLKTADRQAWRRESLDYLNDAEQRRQRSMFLTRGMMYISGTRGTAFDDSVESITWFCKQSLGLSITRVLYDIPRYVEGFSPFRLNFDGGVLKDMGSLVLPDEHLARFGSLTEGKIGSGGIVLGVDIYSGYAVLKEPKRNATSPETYLITAAIGGGKSYMAKYVAVQMLALPQYNGTINDIEGDEYTPLADQIKDDCRVVIVNMAEGSGSYCDTLEIPLTGNAEIDKGSYSLSISFTLSQLETMIGLSEVKNDAWAETVLDDAIAMTYASAGVTEDISTWGNSSGLTLRNVYTVIKSLLTSGDSGKSALSTYGTALYASHYSVGGGVSQNDVSRLISSNQGYQSAVQMIIARLSRYFEHGGVRENYLKTRVTLDMVRDAKLVICSFGMHGKPSSAVNMTQMQLMQLYAAYISYLRSIFSKACGKFNFKIWEEFQRWCDFPGSENTISTAITGGRKLGDINIIVTNDVGKLLSDDRFSLLVNVQTVMIGNIPDKGIRDALCDRLAIPGIKSELDLLARKNKVADCGADKNETLSDFKENPYSHAFVVGADKSMFTIARVELPPNVSKSKLFWTGVTLKGVS